MEAIYQCCLAPREVPTRGSEGFWPAKAKTSIEVPLAKAKNPGV